MIGDGEYVLAEVNAFPGMPGRKMMDAYASVIDDFKISLLSEMCKFF